MKSFISTFENFALRKRILRDGLLSDMSDNSRYQNLVAAYHKAYLSTGTKQSRLIAAQNEWNRVKRGGGGSCKIKTSSAGGVSWFKTNQDKGEGVSKFSNFYGTSLMYGP